MGGERMKQYNSKPSKVVAILMKRDGLTRGEAKALVEECRQALLEGNTNAIQEYLGLEDDYIFDVLD